MRAATWPLLPLLLAGTFVADTLREDGLVSVLDPGALPLVVAMLACWGVGVVVSSRAPAQGAGWALVGLGTALAWSAFTDDYSDLARVDDRAVPASTLVATLGDTSFVWWFVFLALVLQVTPPSPPRGLGRWLPRVTIGAGIAFQGLALLRSTPLAAPRDDVVSPLAVSGLAGPTALLAAVAIYVLAACLLGSVGVLVLAWRRSAGESRRQMMWLVAGAVPLAPAVVGSFVASSQGREDVAVVLLGLATILLVTGTGLSVLRYRLYDVERVLTASAAWAIASVAVVAVYVAVVVIVQRSGPPGAGSQLTTVAATLASVGVARASYLWGRRAVGRRVNPRRFTAVEVLRSGLAGPSVDLDSLVARVLGAGARVLYPAPGGGWVTSGGLATPADDSQGVESRGADAVDVHRRGRVVARVEFDPREVEREVAESVAHEAAPELDNVGLRAELARQLGLVRESRARLATAHLEERRRIERDLHDGAQQRLLAIAMQLQSARLQGGEAVLAAEAGRAIESLQATVQELRDLAAGLQPAALAGGGLRGAVADLAARAPVTLAYDVVDARFPSDVESAAWFVVAEAVTNAVKHSGAERVEVRLTHEPGAVHIAVRDEGVGAADPSGRGLQGLADRVAAAGGSLSVSEAEPRGTLVAAELPCAS